MIAGDTSQKNLWRQIKIFVLFYVLLTTLGSVAKIEFHVGVYKKLNSSVGAICLFIRHYNELKKVLLCISQAKTIEGLTALDRLVHIFLRNSN